MEISINFGDANDGSSFMSREKGLRRPVRTRKRRRTRTEDSQRLRFPHQK